MATDQGDDSEAHPHRQAEDPARAPSAGGPAGRRARPRCGPRAVSWGVAVRVALKAGGSGQAEGAGIGNPPPPPGTGATRMVPAIRSRARLALPALPFAVIAAIGVSRVVMGPGWGMLPLLAAGPAVAAAVDGPLCTLAAGAAALAAGLPFAAGMQPAATHRVAEAAFLTVAGVTAAGVLASRRRRHPHRELAPARLVAAAAHTALPPPVPP